MKRSTRRPRREAAPPAGDGDRDAGVDEDGGAARAPRDSNGRQKPEGLTA